MNETGIIFNSRDERFKHPYGAVRSGTEMTFSILVHKSVGARAARVVFLYDRHEEPAVYSMAGRDTQVETDEYETYETSFKVDDTGLYWYHFEIDTDGGRLCVRRDADTNKAVISDDPSDWQQTVYKRIYEEPSWIYGGVYYHIFVDRFFHAGPNVCSEGKRLRDDWGGTPEYLPRDGRILNNDFFGGNLQGIREKLPYLNDLGVTCLYLSPIFEAYSSHKYDTGDYMKIDPMFGTEKDFSELCDSATRLGMRVICDGVFAHTGDDSLYFDKYSHYGGHGAWTDPDSEYRDWYCFNSDGSYEKWWGIDTLPRIKKECTGFWDLITGDDGVARHWMRAGAAGWRLDVADELPAKFVERLAKVAHEEKTDTILIGEVWEDASKKEAYGERKNYFEGDKLDSVMNYPFKDAIIDFVRNGNAHGIDRTVEELLENYPPEVVNALMNNLGTHDSVRIITALAGKQLDSGASREEQIATRMSDEEWERGVRLLKTAVVLQMTLPGVPCVYYGDETGTEGYADPFNRTCFPWGHENTELLNWYRKIIAIRRDHSVYERGRYRTAAAFGGLYAFERYDEEGGRIVTAANCGETAEELMLIGRWKSLLTDESFEDNITVYPGEVMLLEKE